MTPKKSTCFVSFALLALFAARAVGKDLTVAPGGSGDFKTAAERDVVKVCGGWNRVGAR